MSQGPVEWTIFGLALFVPLLLSLVLGVCRGGTKTYSAYILGNRNLGLFPVSVSLAVSYLAPGTLTGVLGEVAYYGTLYPWTYLLAVTAAVLTLPNILIPVFHKMHLSSVYEYLELRYSCRSVRLLASLTFILTVCLYLSLALYVPSVSLSLLTGAPVWAFILAGGIFSSLVTGLGGLRAIVWSDAWQATIILGSLTSVVVLGYKRSGAGLAEVWTSSRYRQRIQLADWSTDPTQRSSTLGIFAGQFIQWGAVYSCHQTQVQRYCANKSIPSARWSVSLNLIVIWLINGAAILAGLAIFSAYRDCDPLAAKLIKRPEELTTHLVLDVLGEVDGLVGLYLAALASVALSILSSGLNSLASVLWEDFLHPSSWAEGTSEKKKTDITRCLASVFGMICTGLAVGFCHLDTLLQVATHSLGTLSGPLLSVFLLGYFANFTNKMGAVLGLLAGHAVTLWILLGSLLLTKSPDRPTLTLSTEGCPHSTFQIYTNKSNTEILEEENKFRGVEYIYRLSPFLHPLVGFLVASLVSLTVSPLTNLVWAHRDPPQHLVHPLLRRRRCVPPPFTEASHWEQESHYRWPSPSLPPTLKKPRPGSPGESSRGVEERKPGMLNGFDNSSYDDWSDVNTRQRSLGWSTLQSKNSTLNRFYNSRL